MRHYEIVFLVHPDQSEQVPAMIERYNGTDCRGGGTVHRSRGLGPSPARPIPIAKVHKAHYVLMNIECDQNTLTELTGAFRFSDAVFATSSYDGRGRDRAVADGEGRGREETGDVAMT